MNPGGFHLAGNPWWVILPIAIAIMWGIGFLIADEMQKLSRRSAKSIIWLRRTAILLAMLMFLEPVYTRVTKRHELPTLAVVIDHSASMGIDDRGMHPSLRLDEAEALGLLDGKLRPDAGAGVAEGLHALADDLPELARAVTGPASQRQILAMRERFKQHRQHIEGRRHASLIEAQPDIDELAKLLAEAMRILEHGGSSEERKSLGERLVSVISSTRGFAKRAEAAQRAADTALLAGAETGSPVAKAMEELGTLHRAERARRLVVRHVLPASSGRVKLEVFAASRGQSVDSAILRPLALESGPLELSGSTDLAEPLAWLSRNWSARHSGGVLLIGDGRQTTGGDPIPLVRALAARGAPVHTLVIGDPEPPFDAAIEGISGPVEIFRGESVHLDVRWRVSGLTDRSWDIVLGCEGKEVSRKIVNGDGTWQVARFEIEPQDLPDLTGVPLTFTARIESSRRLPGDSPIRPGGGVLRETWKGVSGARISDFFLSGTAPRRADEKSVVPLAKMVDASENTASRIRGWIVPPETGNYTLWLSSDDESELWLGLSGTPYDRIRVASVPEWTQVDEWDRYASQRSLPISLVAGQPCYLEILHKQGSGLSHIAVGWQLPSNVLERPLPVSALAPWAEVNPEAVEEPRYRPEASMMNNEAEIAIMINDDPLRILIVDHLPRWDMRYITALFERDRRIEVIRRYRSIRLPRGEQELLPASQEQIDGFDVIVLGDLAPGEITAEDQQRLAAFVARRGGFLIAIAGPRGMPWGYSLGDLAEILPIRTGATPDARRSLRLSLDAGASEHPITRILDDRSLNSQLWSALEPVQWAATSVTAKPGVHVLLHTAETAKAPVIVVSRHGAGRVAWVGTDETWRWRDRLGDRVHQAFWIQLMRWGLGSRLRGSDRRLQVALERPLIQPGESVDLRARALLDDGQPAGRLRTISERIDAVGAVIPGSTVQSVLAPVLDSEHWSQRLTGLDEGRWRITTVSDHPDLAGLSEVRELLVRRRPGSEGVDIGADAGNFARIAAIGGGRAYTPKSFNRDIAEHIRRLEPKVTEQRSTSSLWQTHAALLLIVALLSIEWYWRKRQGLP